MVSSPDTAKLHKGSLPRKHCDKSGGLILWLRLAVLLHTAGDVDSVEAGLPVSGDQGGEEAVWHPGDRQQRVHREREDLVNNDLLLTGMIQDDFPVVINIKPGKICISYVYNFGRLSSSSR